MQDNSLENKKKHFMGFRCDYSLYASAIDRASKLGISLSAMLTTLLYNALDKKDEAITNNISAPELMPAQPQGFQEIKKLKKDKLVTCKELFSEENEIILHKLTTQFP